MRKFRVYFNQTVILITAKNYVINGLGQCVFHNELDQNSSLAPAGSIVIELFEKEEK